MRLRCAAHATLLSNHFVFPSLLTEYVQSNQSPFSNATAHGGRAGPSVAGIRPNKVAFATTTIGATGRSEERTRRQQQRAILAPVEASIQTVNGKADTALSHVKTLKSRQTATEKWQQEKQRMDEEDKKETLAKVEVLDAKVEVLKSAQKSARKQSLRFESHVNTQLDNHDNQLQAHNNLFQLVVRGSGHIVGPDGEPVTITDTGVLVGQDGAVLDAEACTFVSVGTPSKSRISTTTSVSGTTNVVPPTPQTTTTTTVSFYMNLPKSNVPPVLQEVLAHFKNPPNVDLLDPVSVRNALVGNYLATPVFQAFISTMSLGDLPFLCEKVRLKFSFEFFYPKHGRPIWNEQDLDAIDGFEEAEYYLDTLFEMSFHNHPSFEKYHKKSRQSQVVKRRNKHNDVPMLVRRLKKYLFMRFDTPKC